MRRLLPPQRDRSVASRWRPELDKAKSGSRLRKTAFFQTDGYLVLKE
ncbi:hypothetical protein [Geobacillus sp. E263]|nr:hypothetical protein [Geobacillus sp. E263]